MKLITWSVLQANVLELDVFPSQRRLLSYERVVVRVREAAEPRGVDGSWVPQGPRHAAIATERVDLVLRRVVDLNVCQVLLTGRGGAAVLQPLDVVSGTLRAFGVGEAEAACLLAPWTHYTEAHPFGHRFTPLCEKENPNPMRGLHRARELVRSVGRGGLLVRVDDQTDDVDRSDDHERVDVGTLVAAEESLNIVHDVSLVKED